jgi:hypothetical protein
MTSDLPFSRPFLSSPFFRSSNTTLVYLLLLPNTPDINCYSFLHYLQEGAHTFICYIALLRCRLDLRFTERTSLIHLLDTRTIRQSHSMQHIFSLRVVVLVVGFFGIVAGHSLLIKNLLQTPVFAIHYDITAVRYPVTISDLPMSKYDDIWPQAVQEALQLKNLGYTPQQACTALAKQFFKDTLVETLPCHLQTLNPDVFSTETSTTR